MSIQPAPKAPNTIFDILVIGGGVNGTAIARDAAGRGLKTALLEKGDLASQTSSKSTKLFHGGLRYLEYFEFKLVREALRERDILLHNMPHISWPKRFVIPYDPEMRFDAHTPVSAGLSRVMPWLKGRRPAWMLRAGLFLYDHIGGKSALAGTRSFALQDSVEGAPLKGKFARAYEYSDGWVDDARLVALMAKDARDRGAVISTRNRALRATRNDTHWEVESEAGTYRAKCLVNATGPWVESFMRENSGLVPKAHVRLVKGSHIVLPKLYNHDKCYFFQGHDGRIVFAIPYEQDFTLIGTTDEPFDNPENTPICSDAETEYLCKFVSDYFAKPVRKSDVIWQYSGVRPLYDDGAKSATAATREYVLTLNDDAAPILNVFGGKITTHRKLAERALEKLSPHLEMGEAWTHDAPLPGGDFSPDDREALIEKLHADYPFLGARQARRWFQSYGLLAFEILGKAKTSKALGEPFGAGLSAREIRYLMKEEFAQTAEDILWRRSKLGLHMSEAEQKEVKKFVDSMNKNAGNNVKDKREARV